MELVALDLAPRQLVARRAAGGNDRVVAEELQIMELIMQVFVVPQGVNLLASRREFRLESPDGRLDAGRPHQRAQRIETLAYPLAIVWTLLLPTTDGPVVHRCVNFVREL